MTMRMDGYTQVTVEHIDRVVTVMLNRPDRRNALSKTLQAELIAAVEEAANDADANVVIIKGAGKSFCSGYDVGSPDSAAQGHASTAPISLPRRAVETVAMARRWSRIWNAPIPTIAQIHGHCLAGGTDLALNCDLVITAEDAVLGFPALRMGGTPPTNNWLYNVGPQWAKRLLFTGDTFTGRMAEYIGFALEAVPGAELDAHVLALAQRIAAMGRDIVAINKHVLNRGLDLMGRTTLQEFAAPMDSIANMAPEMEAFGARSKEIGLSAAFKERDAPFAQGVPIDVPNRRA
jgi:enoyl-CoA hydratase